MNDLWTNRNFTPMLLKEIEKPFNSKDHIYEVKFDGIRAIIFVNKTNIYIQSRNKKDLTHLFPELESIKQIVKKNVIFDGEIILMQNGKPSFSELQKRLHIKNKNKIKNLSIENPVNFIAFDILYENKELTNKKLYVRKRYLNKYKDNEFFIKSKVIENDGIKLYKSIKKIGLEGIVAKEKNGYYHINERTTDFIKIKNKKLDKFIIGGYLIKKNEILSVSLGEYRDNKFYFVGSASIHKTSKIYKKVLKSKKTKNYFCNYEKKINYIEPNISCRVEYLEKTKNGHLRHPIIKNEKE